MYITIIVDEEHPLEFTEEDKALIEIAKNSPIDLSDPDNPELTDEELSKMVRVGPMRYEDYHARAQKRREKLKHRTVKKHS